MKTVLKGFVDWVPMAIAIMGFSLLIYATVQHNYRSSLNDPQIQIAEDGALALLSGKQPAEIVPRVTPIDLNKSLAPFIAVVDSDGTVLETDAVLDGKPPKPPEGIFAYAKAYGEDRVTWQPNETTRIALVVKYVGSRSGRFVASGRNMREIEIRERDLEFQIIIAMLFLLASTLIFKIIAMFIIRKTA